MGKIRDAEGFITVRDSNIENISTVWANNNKPTLSYRFLPDGIILLYSNSKEPTHNDDEIIIIRLYDTNYSNDTIFNNFLELEIMSGLISF